MAMVAVVAVLALATWPVALTWTRNGSSSVPVTVTFAVLWVIVLYSAWGYFNAKRR